MRHSQLLLTLILVQILSTTASISPAAEVAFSHEVAEALTGQRTVWAKPLSGGPLRVLFVAPQSTLTDIAEIAVRLDVRPEVTAFWDSFNIGYDPVACARPPRGGDRDTILSRLEGQVRSRWDVIVLANIDLGLLPETVLSLMLDKVADGAGMVIAHARNAVDSPLRPLIEALEESDAPPITLGVAECAFAGGSLDGIARTLRHHKGRIVLLDYPGDPPTRHCLIQTPADPMDMDDTYADNAYSLAARALCRAAGRDVGLLIAQVEDAAPAGPDEREIPPGFPDEYTRGMRDSLVAQPSRPFRLHLREAASQRYTVHAQMRRVDESAQISYRDANAISRGATSHEFELPSGRGAVMLDTWLLDRKGVVDWHTTEMVLPGWPDFDSLQLSKTWLMPNDSLDVTVEVRSVMNHTRHGTVHARAEDAYGRLVAEAGEPFSYEGGSVTVRLHFTDLIAPLVKLEVYAIEGPPSAFSPWELLNAYREIRYLSVRLRPGPLTMELVASIDEPREYADLYDITRLGNEGVALFHAPAGEVSLLHVTREQGQLLPQLTRIATDFARDGVLREPCLNDPAYATRLGETLRGGALRHWAGASGRFSLGNRNYLCASDEPVCQCYHCMHQLSETLQNTYADIRELNVAWNTDFGDWDFIELPPAIGPGQNGPTTPWLNFRMSMDNDFARFHRWARQQATSGDEAAQIGARFTGDTSPARAYHWPLLLPALDFASVDYSEFMMDMVRSHARPGAWSGVVLCEETAVDEPRLATWLPWRLALSQLPTLWIDLNTDGGDVTHSRSRNVWLAPGGAPTQLLTELASTMQHVRETVGPLLFAATPHPIRVAVYDSHASRHLSDLEAPFQTSLRQSQQAVSHMLRLAGFPFVFIGREQLTRTDVSPYRVIFLPMCRALDEEETKALRDFAASGGALVADVLPGVVDAHGRPRKDSAITSLFGIQSTDATNARRDVLSVSALSSDTRPDEGWVEVDTSVIPENGFALARAGESPAWITHRHEQGHCFLLNHPFRAMERRDGRRIVPAELDALAAFVKDLPDMDDAVVDTGDVFLGDTYRYDYRDVAILAFHADYDAPRQTVTPPFKRDDIVYNLLTGERLTRPHRARLRMLPGGLELYSLVSQEAGELTVDAPDTAFPGQRLPIRILAQNKQGGSAGPRIFLLDFMPGNQPAPPWNRRIVESDSGFAELHIPLAKNETPGRYTLRVRDVLTGMETAVSVKIATLAL